MPIAPRLIEYQHEGTTLEAFFASEADDHRQRPAVLIAHMWGGRVPFVDDIASTLAKMGYASMALDLFGKDVRGTTVEECIALITPLNEDRPRLQRRMKAGLDTLRAQPEVDPARIVVIGYCFGGKATLDLARTGADIAGAVCFHGLLDNPGNTEGVPIKARVLVMHGHEDPMAPPELVLALQNELTAAGCDWQTHVYGHTLHAFTNPQANDSSLGTIFNQRAADRAWQTLLNFLRETLGA